MGGSDCVGLTDMVLLCDRAEAFLYGSRGKGGLSNVVAAPPPPRPLTSTKEREAPDRHL